MALETGSRLGPYEIVGLLASGAMGEVYRARDPRLEREVAIKVLPEEVADPKHLRRFEQEARAAGALNHPNVLAVHDVGTHDGTPYVVSELLEGQTLRARLEGGALPVGKALDNAIQIAHGLAAAHDKGIVHRDLKPDNVFVTNDGRIKILDFGLAKLTRPTPLVQEGDQRTAAAATESGMVLGTVGFMSPEQVRGEAVDHRSDIFSFGAVLYEMLSGVRAFRRDSAVETMNAILKEDPPELPGTGRGISPGLARIVRRCLEKRAGDRFQSAHDLALALEAASSGLSGLSPEADGGPDAALAVGLAKRRQKRLLGGSPRWCWWRWAFTGASSAHPHRPWSARSTRWRFCPSRTSAATRTAST
jgi:eukaryotic-like serine/threonine-protein kinase